MPHHCSNSHSLHHDASRPSTPPGQAIGYNRKRVIFLPDGSGTTRSVDLLNSERRFRHIHDVFRLR